MTEISSVPHLRADRTVPFGEPRDLGLVLASLVNSGTCWLFIAGAEALPLQKPMPIRLCLHGVPATTVEVECTPRYRSPGAVGCEITFRSSLDGRTSLDALFDLVRKAMAPPAPGKKPATDPEDFMGSESTRPDAGQVPAPAAPSGAGTPPPPTPTPADLPRAFIEVKGDLVTAMSVTPVPGAPSYAFSSLQGVDQLLTPAGGLVAPVPLASKPAAEEPAGARAPALLAGILEYLGMRSFTGTLVLEWEGGGAPGRVTATTVSIRKGDLILIEDSGPDQPDAEEAFLRHLEKEKLVWGDDASGIRSGRLESGKSVGNLVFE
ncbi:MAG: hypothetical protein FJ098_16440, partial [Deltaproteobacteria bacterium]|nr:hypothetical protein [Deltaproteobacteria bacterium]